MAGVEAGGAGFVSSRLGTFFRIEVDQNLLPLTVMAEEEIGPEAVRLHDSMTWHLAHALRSETICGLVVHYGSRQRLWADTPEGDRCSVCLAALGV